MRYRLALVCVLPFVLRTAVSEIRWNTLQKKTSTIGYNTQGSKALIWHDSVTLARRPAKSTEPVLMDGP